MPAPAVTFRISIDPSLVPDGDINGLLAALADFGPLLEELGEIMSEAERDNFDSQGAAFGEPWAALSPSTLAEKSRLGFPAATLVRTGLLRDEAGGAVAMDADSVTAGFDPTLVPYAAYHQPAALGGSNSGGRMPSRILVAFSPAEQESMLQAVQDYLDNANGGITGVSVTMEEV